MKCPRWLLVVAWVLLGPVALVALVVLVGSLWWSAWRGETAEDMEELI